MKKQFFLTALLSLFSLFAFAQTTTVTKLHTVENPASAWLNIEMEQGEDIDIQFDYSGFNNITGMQVEFANNWGVSMGIVEIPEGVGTNDGTINTTVTVPATALIHKEFGGTGEFQIIQIKIYDSNNTVTPYAHIFPDPTNGDQQYATIMIQKGDVPQPEVTIAKLHTVENPASPSLNIEMKQGEEIAIQFDYSGFNNITMMNIEFTDSWGGTIMGIIDIAEAVGTNKGTVNTTVTVPEAAIIHTDFGGTGANQLFKILIYHNNGVQYAHQFGDQPYTTIKINKADVAVSGISINPSSETISINGSIDLKAVFAPADATNQTATWSSSNEAVATVDKNTGEVTGIAAGEAIITATSVDGGKTAKSTITVSSETFAVTGITLNYDAREVDANATQTLVPTIAPANATNKKITWTSSDEAVATVVDGVVTYVANGTTTITATTVDGSFSDKCDITSVDTAYFYFDDINKYIAPNKHKTNSDMEVTVKYSMGANRTVGADGIAFWLREMNGGATTTSDYKANVTNTYAGTREGTATENIDLTGATLTADLSDGGWYWMWINCKDDNNKLYEAASEWMANNILIVDENSALVKLAENHLNVYPNPADNVIYIQGTEGNAVASIYTINGSLVKNTKLGLKQDLDVSSLANGTYVLKIEDEMGVNVQLINIK